MTDFKTFFNILQENRGITKLYHSTGVERFRKMFFQNKAVLTYVTNDSDEGDDEADITSTRPGHQNFYMSFSRIPFGGYNIGNSFSHVIIEFNRDRLKQNYRIIPFNYFRNMEMYDPVFDRTTDENEDRLVTNKPVLTNLVRYIDRVNFFFDPDQVDKMYSEENMLMFDELKKAGVAFGIWEDLKRFRTLKNPDVTEKTFDVEISDDVGPNIREPKNNPSTDWTKNILLTLLGDRPVDNDFYNPYTTFTTEQSIEKNVQTVAYRVELVRNRPDEELKVLLSRMAALMRKTGKSFRQLYAERVKQHLAQNGEGRP
jgi:hypothetical protein